MIDFIYGELVHKSPTRVIVKAGNIGYSMQISLQTYGKLPDEGQQCQLFVHHRITIEPNSGSIALFGFAEPEERNIFLQLTSVSGIGISSARLMVSSMSPLEIQQAIVNANIPLIQSIKGIGAKTAQRLVLELQDKLKKEGLQSLFSEPVHNTGRDEALSALVMLGFAKAAAEKALDKVIQTEGAGLSVEQLIKLALKSI